MNTDQNEFFSKFDYDSGTHLGEGGYGEVRLVINNKDQIPYALKRTKSENLQ